MKKYNIIIQAPSLEDANSARDEIRKKTGYSGYIEETNTLDRARRLWEELQEYKPDENGFILFNFERWKRVHDIAPDAIAPE